MDNITPALQTYSIIAAALAAGANLSTSIITFPALLHAPNQTLLQQWHIMYKAGILPVVSLSMSSAAGFAILAYRATLAPALAAPGVLDAGRSSAKRNLYVAAAAAMFALAPYTQVLLMGTIGELEKRATSGKGEDEKGNGRELVVKWGRLNFWRGVMLLVGAGLGTWASVTA